MATVSIIGNGNMGNTIGELFKRAGEDVEILGHEDEATPATGDLVVLAVRYPALAEVVRTRADQLAGKTVIDISNPLDFDTFDSLVVPADESATAQVAAALPHSRVLKAFNTNFNPTLKSGSTGSVPTVVLIAGDDTDAKDSLGKTLAAAGIASQDVGALRRARELEAIGFLQLTLAAKDKIAWTGGLTLQG